MEVGAIERLGERMRRSGAQQATVIREIDEREGEPRRQLQRDLEQERDIGGGLGIE